MKITIDTKEDSPEEIRNIIKMLSSLIREKSYTNRPNIFEDSSPEVTPNAQGNVFGNIFGDTETKQQAETKPEEKTEIKDTPSITEYY